MLNSTILSAAVALALLLPTPSALAQETSTQTEETTGDTATDPTATDDAATVEAAPEDEAPQNEATGDGAPETTEDRVQPEALDLREELAEDTIDPDVVEGQPEPEIRTDETVSGTAPAEDPTVGVMAEEDHGPDAHAAPHIENIDFPFDGPFGSYDVNQLQRGLQVYTEVCSACHGLKYVALRTLSDPGGPELPEDQMREYALQFEVFDEELDDFRDATPADHFPDSGLANAPDLSLMAKGRAAFHGPYGLGINQFFKGIGGAEYIAALLHGYTGEEMEQAGTVLYENLYFPGGWISMAPPLWDEAVVYADGHANDVESMSEDVAAFLMWTAEPKLAARKQAGFAGVVFLTLLSVLLYLTNKRLWARVKHKD